MFRRLLSLNSAVLITTLAVAASAALTRIDTPSIQFQAKGPFGMKISGGFSDVNVSEAGGQVTATANLANIKTGMEERDDHLQGYLTVKSSTFKFDRASIATPEDNKTVSGTVHGTMTLNGKPHAQDFKYQVKRTGSDFHVQALGTILLSNYGLKVCKVGDFAICVEDDVSVKMSMKLRDQ